MDNTLNMEDKAQEPTTGNLVEKVFDNVDEVKECYRKYATELGFSIRTRQSRNGDDGERRFVTFACTRSGKEPLIIDGEATRNIDGTIFGTQESIGGSNNILPILNNANPTMWGVHQSGLPIISREGNFGPLMQAYGREYGSCEGNYAPPMQAYGHNYEMNNPIHPMFSHENILQAHMLPIWRTGYSGNQLHGGNVEGDK